MHFSAAPSAAPCLGDTTARSGVVHVNVRHAGRHTVVGNHLAQHRAMSLVAIGIAVHVQSLPDGAPVGIKALARRFPEGEVRIAAALRELEVHGYLERSRVKLPNGRFVTRTVSYNRPGAAAMAPEPRRTPLRAPAPAPAPLPQAPPMPEPEPEPQPEPQPLPERVPLPDPVRQPQPQLEPEPEPQPQRQPQPQLEPEPEPEPQPNPEPESHPEPQPQPEPNPEPQPEAVPEAPPVPVRQEARDLLARLRCDDARLLLPAREVERLAPGVTQWLDRGVEPEAVRRFLVADLPDDLRHPAGLLAYRLSTHLPPPLPPSPPVKTFRPPDPFQHCDGCHRVFRAPAPGGRCGDCRTERVAARRELPHGHG
ncbi:helix-turn-helix domain-containing protein [Streptomyces sp. NPDC091268]|uniref:helix-turn-helix domain-containing protein n=1 Tax=Streptomyces sp. NPDC091268 TaxID=3365979 RepID=UPI0038179D28